MPNLQTSQLTIPEDVIDFGVGFPSPSLLPRALMAQAAAHRLGVADPSLLQYGAEMGDGVLRYALAEFLGPHYGLTISPEQLFITAGASLTLDLICQQYTQPGDTIFVEEPTYLYALTIFKDYGLNIVGIPMDEEGLIIEAVQAELERIRPAFLYTIPTFHNPSAITLSANRRADLVALSQEYNFLIVADEVYHLLNYQEKPPLPLAGFVETGQVISLGSFSKILAPGVRLGWVQAASQHGARLFDRGFLLSGGGFNPFTSGLVHSLISRGLLAEHLAHLKAVYTARSQTLSDALQHYLPELTFKPVMGGFFLWGEMPDNCKATALQKAAQKRKVNFHPGPAFSQQRQHPHCLRLSFSYYEAEQLEAGVGRLAEAYVRC